MKGMAVKSDSETGEYCILKCPFCEYTLFFVEGVSVHVGDEVLCSRCSRAFTVRGNHFKGSGHFCTVPFRGSSFTVEAKPKQ